MRDNTRRLNPAAYRQQSQRTEPSPQQKEVPVPSFFVDLPSRGLLYPKEHPLHNKEKIEIKEMTAREEEILSSQEFVKAGVAIDRFLDAVVIDLNIDTKSILLADRSAVVYESRKRAYGEALYLQQYECPECGEKQKRKTNISFEAIPKDYTEFSPFAIINEDGRIEFTLSNGQTLQCSGVDIRTEDEIVKTISEKPDSSFINMLLKSVVYSIDEEKDKEVLKEMLLDIPARDSKKIRQTYQKMLPEAKARVSIKCSKCSHVNDTEVPLNADFFWLID